MVTLEPQALDGDSGAPVPDAASEPCSPATEFIRFLSKTPGGILPIPHVNKRRKKKGMPPSQAPRRSRRLAGLGTDMPEVCPIHLKKQVMRALDLNIEEEREQLSQQILEEYAQRFRMFLAHPHTRALASLFGWTPPEGDLAVELVECLT